MPHDLGQRWSEQQLDVPRSKVGPYPSSSGNGRLSAPQASRRASVKFECPCRNRRFEFAFAERVPANAVENPTKLHGTLTGEETWVWDTCSLRRTSLATHLREDEPPASQARGWVADPLFFRTLVGQRSPPLCHVVVALASPGSFPRRRRNWGTRSGCQSCSRSCWKTPLRLELLPDTRVCAPAPASPRVRQALARRREPTERHSRPHCPRAAWHYHAIHHRCH